MNKLSVALILSFFAAMPAYAQYPIFAAQCAGGVNAGGYNIDTDTEKHLWVNGHRVALEDVAEDVWEGAYHGVVFEITSTESGLIVSFTGRGGVNGICTVVSE